MSLPSSIIAQGCLVDCLIQGASLLMPSTGATAASESNSWIVRSSPEAVAFVDYVPDRELLVLSADIGVPAAEGRQRYYETFLQYSQTWEATNGLRFGIEKADGSAWLLQDVAIHCAGPAALAQHLARFLDDCRTWRTFLSSDSSFIGKSPKAETSGSRSYRE
ncbi:MAG TPA: type III secretion system chaperone [Burkholderiaceae bacterium]|nr:type III secretion system chaperone [Burkholderiaceae bacterium]